MTIRIDVDVDITIGDRQWMVNLPHLSELSTRVIEAAVSEPETDLPGDQPLEVSLLFADDETVQRLNSEYRGKDKPTNVLSFPALDPDDPLSPGDDPLMLGDVVMALQTVMAEASAQNKSLSDHVSHLLVHGFLHLIGYDHEDETDALEMEGLETRILASLDVADPYAEDPVN